MQRIVADLHMHTIVSGHAYGTIREMVTGAKQSNLSLIGISEHGPGIPGTTDPIYFTNLKCIPKFIDGVELIHGCEVNCLSDGSLSLSQKYLDYLDYAIVGIHRICYEDQGVEKNTDNLLKCMENKKVMFISHPDDSKTPLNYERLVIGAKQHDVCLELNNSSLNKPERRLNVFDNLDKMLKLCIKYGCKIVVNSDAHDPSQVGRLDKAIALLDKYNFPDELVLNNDLNKIKNLLKLKNE